MDVDPQPVGVQPDRMLDALDPVDGVERGVGVEHDLLAAVDRRLAAAQQFVDVRLLDLVAAQLDLDIGDVADQAAGAEAGPDIVDGHPAHALGDLDRFAHRDFARLHVGDIAALDPAAFALARLPSTRRRPSSSRVTISALTLDEPMSSAAMSGCWVGAAMAA